MPDGCHYCLCWPRQAFRSMQELTFPAAEGTAAGMIRSCSSVYKTGVRLLVMALRDVARFLCAIHCASGWADLAIRICHCAAHCLCWASTHAGILGSPQCPLAFLYLPPNGSHTNWRSGCPDSPFARNLSAHTAATAASDLAAQAACMRRYQVMLLF